MYELADLSTRRLGSRRERISRAVSTDFAARRAGPDQRRLIWTPERVRAGRLLECGVSSRHTTAWPGRPDAHRAVNGRHFGWGGPREAAIDVLHTVSGIGWLDRPRQALTMLASRGSHRVNPSDKLPVIDRTKYHDPLGDIARNRHRAVGCIHLNCEHASGPVQRDVRPMRSRR